MPKNTNAKGRRIALLAKAILEAQGCVVEVAPNVVRWWRDKGTGRWLPRTVKHDYFGVWDMIVLYPDGRRGFVQITTLQNIAAHRDKILAAGEWAPLDLLLGYRAGRGRHFRLCPGPTFELTEERWKPLTESPARP